MQSLSQSYDYCHELTRRTAHNFRFSFRTLPTEKRRAMEALYAFNRITDDLGDDEHVPIELRVTQLATWRESVRTMLGTEIEPPAVGLAKTSEVGTLGSHPALMAIGDTVHNYRIPHKFLMAVIDGVEMDLQSVPIATFSDLQRYCYHVAGAVGLCCIHIWGFHDDRAIPLAIDCGLALQLTNILRDIAEDATAGRVYLPDEDLQKFNYSRPELQAHVFDQRFESLMRFQTERAKSFYERAELLFEYLQPEGRKILRAMIDIYGGLLKEIERRNFDVFSDRVSLPKWKKLWFATRAFLWTK